MATRESLQVDVAAECSRLAHEIATTAAMELVDSCSLEVERDGEKWRDLTDREYDYLAELEDELRYLDLLGRLRRHSSEPRLLQLLEVVQ